MNAREALTARIRFKREHRDRLQARVLAVTSEINDLIAQRDALTVDDEGKLAALQGAGVVRVQD